MVVCGYDEQRTKKLKAVRVQLRTTQSEQTKQQDPNPNPYPNPNLSPNPNPNPLWWLGIYQVAVLLGVIAWILKDLRQGAGKKTVVYVDKS